LLYEDVLVKGSQLSYRNTWPHACNARWAVSKAPRASIRPARRRQLNILREATPELDLVSSVSVSYRRLQASLTRQDVAISEKVVQRLMKQESLVVAKPKRRRYASYLGEISPAPENLINRDFQGKRGLKALLPGAVWMSRIA